MVANLKSRPFLPGLLLSLGPSKSLARAAAGPLPRVSLKVLFMLAGGFWLFVTFTDVLYGYSMQVNAEQVFKAVMFINWNERVLQHLLLFPILVAVLFPIAAHWMGTGKSRPGADTAGWNLRGAFILCHGVV